MQKVKPVIFSEEYIKGMNLGDVVPIEKKIADTLERTGNQRRDMHNWANVYEVKVAGYFCELSYSDRSGISLMRGSNFD